MSVEYLTQPHSGNRALVHLLAARAGVVDDDSRKARNNYPSFGDLSCVGMAREALVAAGQRPAGDPRDVLARAMTSSDFPSILKDAANKIMENSYKYSQGTFRGWMAPAEVSDFKINTFVRLTPPAELFEVGEDQEYKHLAISDGEEEAQLKSYGGLVGISRQAMINDDKGFLKDPGRIAGQTAGMMQSRLGCKSLLSNPVLSDGKAVFHVDRGNLLSGVDSALGTESLTKAIAIMRRLSDSNGNPLDINPKILLVGPENEALASRLCNSDSLPGQSNIDVPNFFKTIGLQYIVDPLLEAPSLTGSSSSAWYLLPDPALWPVFRYVTLSGEAGLAPYIDSQPSWETDGVEYKVRIDFAVVAASSKAVKSLGQ